MHDNAFSLAAISLLKVFDPLVLPVIYFIPILSDLAKCWVQNQIIFIIKRVVLAIVVLPEQWLYIDESFTY